jgi:hypothetical protein
VSGARSPAGARTRGSTAVRLLRLCVCASVIACTDPRPRVAPPTIQVLVNITDHPKSPGDIFAAIHAFDAAGFDSVHVTLKSNAPGFGGDSLYLFPDTTEATLNVHWTVPAGIPAGTPITLSAKVWNLIGFAASDSALLTSQ